jgi:hypothetical protein
MLRIAGRTMWPTGAIHPSRRRFAAPQDEVWHTKRPATGVCQVWDQSIPTNPVPSNYKAVSKPVPTFVAALAVKDGMLKKGTCKL